MSRLLHTSLSLAAVAILAACTSHFEGHKLGDDGHLAAVADGLPYLLPRPEFTMTTARGGDGGPAYTLGIAHVPDPSQRYTLRVNPALLANVDSGITIGATGQLAEVNATVTDNITPTITALGSFAASLLSVLAIVGDVSTVDATIRENLQICSDQEASENLDSFIKFLVRDAKVGLGGKPNIDELLSARLHARRATERNCLVQIQSELERKRELVIQQQAQAFATGMRQFREIKEGDKQFRELLEEFNKTYEAQNRKDPSRIRNLRAAVVAAGTAGNYAPLLQLGITAVEDLDRGDLLKWDQLLSVHPATHDDATGLERAIDTISEAVQLVPQKWLARHLVYLEDCMDDKSLAALQNRTSTCPEDGSATVESLRQQIAAVAGEQQSYERLVKLERYLDGLPPTAASGGSSAFEEYARARAEADILRTRIAAAVTGLIDKGKSPGSAVSKPQTIPLISLARVEASHRCGWSKTLEAQRDPLIAVIIQPVGPDGVPPPVKPPAACIDDPRPTPGSAR